MRSRFQFLLWVALLGPGLVGAHDLSGDVTVQGVVKVNPDSLDFLLRVPMSALPQAGFPLVDAGEEDEGPAGAAGMVSPEDRSVLLDVAAAGPAMRRAVESSILGDLKIYEDGRLLENPQVVAVRASPSSDRSLGTYESALAHVTAVAPDPVPMPLAEAQLDVLLRYPISSPDGEFSFQPGWTGLGNQVVTVLRFVPPSGVMRAFEFLEDPGVVRLDPSWWEAARRFTVLGFEHILDGIDHLLFLFCLVLPFRKFRSLLWMVTAFTVAHSITLIASAFGYAPQAVWFPPMIETGIAASIVYMALENVVQAWDTSDLRETDHPALAKRRAVVTFGFGLVHGFGFSFVLHETLQFAGDHLVSSLLAFNFGVELGQLAVLAVLVPVFALLFKYVVKERIGIIVLSALAAHTGWHWMTERWSALSEMDVPWPGFDQAGISLILRLVILAVVLAGVLWRLQGARRVEE